MILPVKSFIRRVVSIAGKNEFLVNPSKSKVSNNPGSIQITSGLQQPPRRQRENLATSQSVTSENEATTATFPSQGIRNRQKPLIDDNQPLVKDLIVRLLKLRIIKNMTKNGKYSRFSTFVAVGNGNGGIGIAHSKSVNASDAVSKATRIAARSMEYFDRFQNRTIFHDDVVKYKASILYIRPAAPNTGRRCHPAVAEMSRCMGIKDISAKVHGSRNPLNVAQAFLLALKRQKTPEMVAQESGMKIIDVLKVYQQGCEELTKTLRAERYSNLAIKLRRNQGEEDTNENRH